MLAHKFHNITNLDMEIIAVDLSGVPALTTLRTLRIKRRDYATSNVNAVLGLPT
jgi:hypothetical protein